MDQHQSAPRSNPVALAPILVFLALYLGSGITFEYILLGGVNDRIEHAKALVKLVQGISCKFNLIPFNPFPDSDLRKPEASDVKAFQDYLINRGFVTTVRKTRGDDIDAACGQLAGNIKDKTRRAERLAEQKARATFLKKVS